MNEQSDISRDSVKGKIISAAVQWVGNGLSGHPHALCQSHTENLVDITGPLDFFSALTAA